MRTILPPSDVDAEGRDHPSILLASTETAQTHLKSAELQWYDRYSQLMLVTACLFVGAGISALTINGFNDQPAMRIPLMVATIASWFTLATLFLSSMQVHSLESARLKRALMFPAGFLAVSSLAFMLAFVASSWAGTECNPACRTAGVLVERVLVAVIVAGGFTLLYCMQRTLTMHHGSSQALACPNAPSCSLLDIWHRLASRLSPLWHLLRLGRNATQPAARPAHSCGDS